MLRNMRHWAVIVLGILAILFMLQNFAVVEVSFLFWTLSAPRAFLLFLVFAVGIVIGLAIAGWRGGARRDPR